MAKDVIVVVQRDALPSERESLDILLVSTTGKQPVKVYRDIASVEAVFGPNGTTPNAKIVRKAKTLLNQGKTTLADTLVSKFKIVGFEPTSATPATAASLVLTLTNGNLPEPIEGNHTVCLRVGGDDSAVVSVTASEAVSTGAALAALFKGSEFTKGGKTYSAAVKGAVVTFTATKTGEADTIPQKAEVFLDAELTTPVFADNPSATFENGSDVTSAAGNLIKEIKKFQTDVDNDWYYLMTDKDEDEYVQALSKFAEASEPTEAELGAGVEDHRKFYMGQTSNKEFVCDAARAAIIYTDAEYLREEPDASYTGNVAPFYPTSVTWKFKRPQNGNAEVASIISLPQLTDGERDSLLERHVNFLTEEYKRQYVKDGTCLNGEFIDVVLGGDWIAKRMRDLLYDLLLENANINYDDAGFGFIATAVLQALSEAVDHNIIARDAESKAGVFTVVIPKYSESTEEQRRNRTMPDITWEALLSGAIHNVKVKGALRASL